MYRPSYSLGIALAALAFSVLACGDARVTAPPVARSSDATLATIGFERTTVAGVIFGITAQNRLVSFAPAAPQILLSSATVTGLASTERLTGIDFRPANGVLYGVTDKNAVYTIDTKSASAYRVGSAPLSTAINSRQIGFDFNPVADRIRVHTVADQNLRLNPALGTLAAVDTALAYQSGDANFGRNPSVSGTAYTNSTFNGGTPPAATVLYAIDQALGLLVTLPSPNGGKLKTVGSLGFKTPDNVAFDIAGTFNTAYAAWANSDNSSRLYLVDLGSGKATLVGTIGAGNIRLISLSVAVK